MNHFTLAGQCNEAPELGFNRYNVPSLKGPKETKANLWC